jgi:hypothetical protein
MLRLISGFFLQFCDQIGNHRLHLRQGILLRGLLGGDLGKYFELDLGKYFELYLRKYIELADLRNAGPGFTVK